MRKEWVLGIVAIIAIAIAWIYRRQLEAKIRGGAKAIRKPFPTYRKPETSQEAPVTPKTTAISNPIGFYPPVEQVQLFRMA
jgi:hypothetical protein